MTVVVVVLVVLVLVLVVLLLLLLLLLVLLVLLPLPLPLLLHICLLRGLVHRLVRGLPSSPLVLPQTDFRDHAERRHGRQRHSRCVIWSVSRQSLTVNAARWLRQRTVDRTLRRGAGQKLPPGGQEGFGVRSLHGGGGGQIHNVCGGDHIGL